MKVNMLGASYSYAYAPLGACYGSNYSNYTRRPLPSPAVFGRSMSSAEQWQYDYFIKAGFSRDEALAAVKEMFPGSGTSGWKGYVDSLTDVLNLGRDVAVAELERRKELATTEAEKVRLQQLIEMKKAGLTTLQIRDAFQQAAPWLVGGVVLIGITVLLLSRKKSRRRR